VEPSERSHDAGEAFRRPRPARSVLLLLVPVPLIAALGALGVLPPAIAAALAVFQTWLALVQGGLGAYGLRRLRRRADALLRGTPGLPPDPPLTAWRAAALTSPRSRRALARHLRGLRSETRACLPSRELRLAVLEETERLLRKLEQRVGRLSGRVSALGMLELHALVIDDISPLFFPERAEELPALLSGAYEALGPE
jgi:hypothetical protein